MPGSITGSWRTGSGVSLRNAACQIHNVSYSVSLGATTVEPTISTEANDVRRCAGVDLLDAGRPPGIPDDPARAQAMTHEAHCEIRLIKLHRFFEFTRPVLRHRAYAFGCLHLAD
jgi:hypothetical protein